MKFLATKLSSLQSELAISREIFRTASTEVDSMFKKKYFPEVPTASLQPESDEKSISEKPQQENKKQNNPHEGSAPEPPQNTQSIASPEVKKLFRRISLNIHPDKLLGMPEGYEKEKKRELYLKALKARDENELLILADIAIELGIDPPEITGENLKTVEKKIKDIKTELNQIESTVVWLWFFTEDKKKKNQILEKLFNIMYEQQKK